MMNLLVTGGAGYIGSVVAERLIEHGHRVTVLDNLTHGHRAAVPAPATLLRGDLLDREWVHEQLRVGRFDGVIHLAAEALIDESIRDPGRFFRVNVTGGLNLLDAMAAAGVRRLIFSSTAAVYGEPLTTPIVEDASKEPVNAYGESKLALERALAWYARSHGLRHVSLRYFNACGATAQHGERHEPETHLIAILLEVALGIRPAIQLFGSDYDTPDGTCIRDYIHVSDIANAHILCLMKLDEIESGAFNLGNGAGLSNRQVIEAVERVTGRSIRVIPAPRRPGDPARLVASAERISRQLGWRPELPEIEQMIESAWKWRLARYDDYADTQARRV